MRKSKKPWPTLPSDEAAEEFTAKADLSEFDWNAAEPIQHEFARKDARLELRLPETQLDALKTAAKKAGIPHTRLVRQFIERGLEGLRP